MRDDEEAALSIGKNVVALRIAVQAVGGAMAGVSGALLAGFLGGWSPGAWFFIETMALLTAIIVGRSRKQLGCRSGHPDRADPDRLGRCSSFRRSRAIRS